MASPIPGASATMVVSAADAIQAAKAGILEIADVFCVNKADRDGVDRTVRELRDMQHLGHPEWLAPICKTVASSDVGIAALIDAVDGHRAWLQESGRLDERRRQRARTQVHQITLGEVRRRFTTFDDGQLVDELAAAVAERKLDPYTAADRLLERFEG